MSGEPLHLITTADERTWPTSGPVLWLGEWCRLYSRRQNWEPLGGELLPYHWEDRERFEQDYRYLDGLYEQTLITLTSRLNDLHGATLSARYWRILVGPWLAYFIHILYDRWLSIRSAKSLYPIAGTVALPALAEAIAPNDMSDFLRLTRDDGWNGMMYGEIIERFTSIPITRLSAEQSRAAIGAQPVLLYPTGTRKRFGQRVGTAIRSVAEWVASKLGKYDDVFINTPYLTKRTLLRLFLRLRQIPVIWSPVAAPRVGIDVLQRAWNLNQVPTNEFECFLLESIPSHLPRYCLEGYGELLKCVRESPWPSSPKILYTANVLWHDVVSMAYFAEKAERGAEIVYGQHGGVYGTAKFQFAREHERKISDRYLVWGQSGTGGCCEQVVGITKLDSVCVGPFANRRRLLFVTLNTPRYSYRLCSESARNFSADLHDSYTMVHLLHRKIFIETVVRLIPVELGWSLPQRWRDRFPDLIIDPGHGDIFTLMRTSRIVAFNYNQTGFLETMAQGIPTVLLCDFSRYPLTSEAQSLYRSLESVGICHTTPESAAAHVNRVWDNIDAWWSSFAVQEAAGQFCRQYCDLTEGLVDRVFRQLSPSRPKRV